ncbi:hypothetical protein FQA39_LY12031, partial [Lamprigera yunnana]
MSVTYAQRGGRATPSTAQIQKILDENGTLIQTIQEHQNKGKAQECSQYQHLLHRNLIFLSSIADATQNIHALLPVGNPAIVTSATPSATSQPYQPPYPPNSQPSNPNPIYSPPNQAYPPP